MSTVNRCPHCGKGAAPGIGCSRDANYCHCSWEQIALAYEAQGEKALAVVAWKIAALGATGRPARE